MDSPSPLLTAAKALKDGCRRPVSRKDINRAETSARSARYSWESPSRKRSSRNVDAKAATNAELLRSMERAISQDLTVDHEQLFLPG